MHGLKNRSEKCEGPGKGLMRYRTGVGNGKDRLGRGGIDGLKNRSGKCEGPGGGHGWVKEPVWEMRRIGRGKEPEWVMRRTEAARGDQRLFEKIKVFF